MTHARIVDGVVFEVIPPHPDGFTMEEQFPADFVASCVALTAAQAKKVRPGWTWDGETFAAPVAPEPPPALPRTCTPLAFMERFTDEEEGRIIVAAAQAAAAGEPGLQRFMLRLSAAGIVELDHPSLLEGMSVLVAMKLLTKARAEAILSA